MNDEIVVQTCTCTRSLFPHWNQFVEGYGQVMVIHQNLPLELKVRHRIPWLLFGQIYAHNPMTSQAAVECTI